MTPNPPQPEPRAEAAPRAGAAAFNPEQFGRYYLVDRIAVGGMAEIFKAISFGTGGFEKLLVIKRILSHHSENDEFVRMFRDEANVSTHLQHANIVQTYDFGKIHDNYFIAMEFVEGKDVKSLLRKLAQRRKLLPIEYAVYIAHEACKGLDYAHRCTNIEGRPLGIVHRDMSPSNVIITYEGEVKLADFGIAKASSNTYNTKDGVLKGKFEYMSPEQASGAEVDRRSDIFSTGIILYECLTGRRLFKTDSEIKTLERIKACDIDPPSTMNQAVPAKLDRIVMRALAQNPVDRYEDAREFQNDLLEFLYPLTPDGTRQNFSRFLRDLFSEEIAEERARLEGGRRVASEMASQAALAAEEAAADTAWEERGPLSGTLNTAPSRWPWVVASILFLVLAGAVAFLLLRPAPEPAAPLPPSEPTTAALSVRARMPARVYLDGALVGEGAVVQVQAIAPGNHKLRVEADGYQPYEEDLVLAAGDVLPVPVPLEAVAKEPTPPTDAGSNRPPTDAVPSGSGTLHLVTSPAGASVLIDGRMIAGRTPTDWSGRAGSSVRVEYRLDGYSPLATTVRVPSAGRDDTISRTLEKQAAAPPPSDPTPPPKDPTPAATNGAVTVIVSGGGAATVWIDGKKVGEAPLRDYSLPPGSHQVRVVNSGTGLDIAKTVTVVAGPAQKVVFKVE